MPKTLADFQSKGNRILPSRERVSRVLYLLCFLFLATDGIVLPPPAEADSIVGVLFPQRSLDLLSEVGGTVESCRELGDAFEEGDLLVRIDAPTLRFDLATARAQLTAADAQVTIAELNSKQASAELDRRLQSPGSWSQEELDRSRLEADASRARWNLALADRARYEAQVSKLEEQNAKTRLCAPFAGVVTGRAIEPGELVEPGEQLLRLITADRLGVRFAVSAEQVHLLQPGQQLEISFSDGALGVRIPLLRFGPEIDTATGLAFAEAGWLDRVALPGALAGMIVQVLLPEPSADR